MIVPGFEHRPGVHCGSTALADALRARGLDLSEPMAFGLGAGLGFFYDVSPALSPTRIIGGRSAELERVGCEILGAPVRARTEDDPSRAWAEVRSAVDRGLAPVLVMDLAELPYWNTRTRFAGHRVALAGYDEARGVALVADTHWPGLQEVGLDVLERARASSAPPYGMPGRPWLEIDAPARPRPLGAAIRDALRRQSRDMLIDVDGSAGVSALERFAEDLPAWPRLARDEADRSWMFRYAYQCIEKRGNGGGLFRRLYAGFLAEAEAALPSLAGLGLRADLEAIADAWTSLSEDLRAIGAEPGGAVPARAGELAHDIARRERRFFEEMAARVP